MKQEPKHEPIANTSIVTLETMQSERVREQTPFRPTDYRKRKRINKNSPLAQRVAKIKKREEKIPIPYPVQEDVEGERENDSKNASELNIDNLDHRVTMSKLAITVDSDLVHSKTSFRDS